MKKIIFLIISILSTNFSWSQVTVNPPATIEVGQNYTFSFIFLPSSNIPQGSTSYILTSRFISCSNANMNNSGTNSYADNSQALNEYSLSQSQSVSFPIKWVDNSNNLSETFNITTNVNFYKIVDNNKVFNGTYPYTQTYTVNIKRILTPTISSTPILDCCNDPVTFTATNFGTANVFNWTVNGITYPASSTSSITVAIPSGTNQVSASCIVSRSTGSPSYTRSNSITVNRTARSATYTVSAPPVATSNNTNYLCKGTGRTFSIAPQCGLQSVTWIAPNCTIIGQGTTTATITPNSSVANGSIININATVSYVGGCSAQTQNTAFTIFDTGSTTTPLGSVSVNQNPANVPLQNISEWIPSFRMQKGTSINYGNGIFVLNPDVLQVLPQGRMETVQVCYLNVCNGSQSCANFQVWVPGVANWTPYRIANPSNSDIPTTKKRATVYPNPTDGLINIKLDNSIEGNYQIFDISGKLIVQEGKINNQNQFQIEISKQLISGIYILKIITENDIYTEKIILNK